jgi:sugar lactone lactonase YvrE
MLKKKHIFLFIALMLFLVQMSEATAAYAYVPYETYTYDALGKYFISPQAYEPSGVINATSLSLETALNSPGDIVADEQGYIYISDTGNSRILVMDDNYQLVRTISGFVDQNGEEQTFNQPEGIFVTEDNSLYIADSKNSRIVVLDIEGNFKDILEAPSSEVLQGLIYEPSALAVDDYDRIYVIAKSTNMGVISLEADGMFAGFIGAEKTSGSFGDIISDLLKTDAQRARSNQNVPTEYNNITIDKKGFPYVTSSALSANEQYSSMVNNDTSATPVKKLNPSGVDVLRRNGAFGQAGDIRYIGDVSRFVDVAVGEDGTYSVLDSTRSRIFTYDINGNLLYVFGGSGSQVGVFRKPVALCYQGSDLLVLDSNTGIVTVFSRTSYGDSIALALKYQNNRNYTAAADQWHKVLELNSNFDQAYTGVAASYMRLEKYEDAMKNYKLGNNLEGFRKAFTEYRKELMEEYFLLIPAGIILIILILGFIIKQVTKVNDVSWAIHGKRTLKEELCFSYYTMFHPFDGYYELKRDHHGGMRGALVIFGLAIFNYLFREFASGYMVTGTVWKRISLYDALMTVGFVIILWTVANWALTTLMDGKGKMRDIFIATCYSLMPMILLGIPATILSNYATSSELQFIYFLNNLGLYWTVFLIFFGILTTNEYSLSKNILTTLLSLIGMGFIAFIGILFINVLNEMWEFGRTIISEIIYRI